MNLELIKKYSILNSDVISPELSHNDLRTYLGPENKYKLLQSVPLAFRTALQFCNVAKGDVVIVQAIGPRAALDVVLSLGAIPLLVDSEQMNWNISAFNVEMVINNSVITYGVRPKAIVLKHHMGVPAFMDEVGAVAYRHRIPIIEDCISSFGAYFKDKPVGTLGHYSIYSLGGHRVQGPGYAMLVHRVPKFDELLDRHLAHDKTEYTGSLPEEDQLPALQQNLARRQEIYARYRDGLNDVSQLEVFENHLGYIRPSYAFTSIIVKDIAQSYLRDDIVEAVTQAGYPGACVFSPSLNATPEYTHVNFYGCRVGNKVCTNGFVLPSQPSLTDEDVDRIIEVVKKTMP